MILLFGVAVSFVNFAIHAVMTALIVVATRRTKTRTHISAFSCACPRC